ncbi:pectate lyase family protein [Amycolatopsis magusensis]|uniref:Pectate lyase n=1 Tax=Amycolatopsis magusensis TaxID=882444 RepID=A0ABS4PY83_9PSEU|nr:CBM35 domain-containing protein [Amycolatopsis magusensis]MBP2184392.1 pectate lyase [Amycolatopsis magusensis]MDI5975699.1 CBM35 domain-containing protein [Amycolatopsis magusensis]
MRPMIACVSLFAGALVAVASSAAQAAPTRYEAENTPAVCSGTIDSNWSGYSSSGFCNGANSTSGYLQFTVNAAAAGTATLGVRFANGTTTARPADLVVNGATVQTPSFEGTGAWATWTTKTLSVPVTAGSNTIRLNPGTAGGLPNIDYLDVEAGDTPQPPGGIVGWATQAGGTTGGAAGSTVTVSSFADFRTQAQASGARTILVNGMLSGSGTVEISANKTIRGVGAGSGVSGTTLNIEDMRPANVIIQNMNIRGVPGNDAIQIENATHIWIDHNTMSSTIENDPDFYDGMLDITHAADYITVSWNVVRDHWKTSLVGHSDGNGGEDRGHLRVTYHHNWFDRTFERSPRVRFGETVHVFNNYYSNVDNNTDSYAIASLMDAGLLVEGNVFENVQQACWSASGYADSDPGRLVARDNLLTDSGPCETGGTVAAIPYSYTADSATTVKSSVTTGAGAGKL